MVEQEVTNKTTTAETAIDIDKNRSNKNKNIQSVPTEENKKEIDQEVHNQDRSQPIIRAQNLDFIYNHGKTNEFHALINISFDIYSEEFIIIFGPSGCGKSTLLNVMAGLETPDRGSIFVFDRDLTKMNTRDFAVYHRKQVGMIYQAYNLITSLTVLENVVLPQIFVNVGKGRRERWGKTLLERFGILSHANKIPTELSGGQQQRIGIARSIVNNPQIILADEPVGNLDSKSAKLVLSILSDLNTKEKKTVILVTHNPEYLDYADRILYMKDGVITREVVNRDKQGNKEIKKPKTAIKEINELMRAYQGMTPEQINILIMPYKAKVFAHHFISSRNMEETKIFEEAVQRRLLGTISEEDFFVILDRATSEGGVGFDSRTAKKIVRRINRVIRMAYFIYQKGHQHPENTGEHKKISFSEKAEKVKKYLYKTCYNQYYQHLNDKQDERIKRAIKERLMSTMDKNSFYDFLDRSFKEGGVGLNSKTAKSISEELELILVLGFGVVGVNERSDFIANKSSYQDMIAKEEKSRDRIELIHKHQVTPNPGDILNKMQDQLNQKVKTVNDLSKNDILQEEKKETNNDVQKEQK